ncbi:hypothetical protein LTS18_008467, partial [Coniosporium uncinatum]
KHQQECGGTYTKIAEPELTKDQVAGLSPRERAGRQKNKIDSWVKDKTSRHVVKDVAEVQEKATEEPKKRPLDQPDNVHSPPKDIIISCPICDAPIPERIINQHLDVEHSP